MVNCAGSVLSGVPMFFNSCILFCNTVQFAYAVRPSFFSEQWRLTPIFSLPMVPGGAKWPSKFHLEYLWAIQNWRNGEMFQSKRVYLSFRRRTILLMYLENTYKIWFVELFRCVLLQNENYWRILLRVVPYRYKLYVIQTNKSRLSLIQRTSDKWIELWMAFKIINNYL